MFITSLCYFFLLIILNKSYCEEFNLYGDAGQAYALEINVGHPEQKLSVLVDTGSTTLAIASYARKDSNKYFRSENSTTLNNSGKEVQAKYSQGTWVGHLASDLVKFSSLKSVPEVRCDIALITKSHKFFMNGSGWQGLLGLAYLPVGAWGENVVVGSWLDSVEKNLNKPMSFQLKLCGVQSITNATHYGKFEMFDDSMTSSKSGVIYRTPILRKRWYEVGVLAVRISTPMNKSTNTSLKSFESNQTINDSADNHYRETCIKLNEEKSIVDSGTTNIRLPDMVFREVVNELRSAAQTSNMLILDEFWYHGEAACWPEPQEWSLPSIAIDLLSTDADNQYFTLEIPPQNFMRVVTARNNSGEGGTVSEFCYKLGLEAGGKETVLGYTAMEGLQVLFNRSAGWIGWQPSNCGPKARITGPHNYSMSLTLLCELTKPVPDVAVSIKAAQWTLCAISIIAAAVLIYLLAPCIKMFLVRPLPRSQQISLSQAALVEQEAS
ncbi:beta-secretase 1-like [Vanessa atalanta]|uniref:beta-secretase 1-like n=1 Tax=Vanessa atalanta TaxID=42275 RepID=UPI001FCD53E2|nr:beta-secretase 1-like [Vanessa atalanta]